MIDLPLLCAYVSLVANPSLARRCALLPQFKLDSSLASGALGDGCMSRSRVFIFMAATLSATLWAYACGEALVHESAPAPTLRLRPGGIRRSWRSSGRCHGRREVEPSQPQVQDQAQNSELARVRACPQEPRRRHDLAERGGDRYVDTTEEWSLRRPAAVLGPRILTALTLRLLFRLPLRQAEGFLDSLLSWMGLELKTPDHTTLSRRNQIVEVQPLTRAHDGPIDLIVDSTGLKILGSGEWKVHKHKASKATPGLEEAAHRSGRGGIHCGGRTHAGQRGRRLNLAGPARPVRGSHPAAHGRRGLRPQVQLRSDRRGRNRGCHDRDPAASLGSVVGSDGRSVEAARSGACEDSQVGTARVAEGIGLSPAGTGRERVFRYKSVLGGQLKARNSKAQGRETAIGCHILNRMAALGQPNSDAVMS